MKAQRFLAVLWIALSLLLGQQAAALHDLSHATEQLGDPLKAPAGKHTCDQCFLSAQLAGAVGTHVSIPPVVAAKLVVASFSFLSAPSRTVVFSRSRAPPAAA